MKDDDKLQPSDKEHGEGNYKASRQYNEATKRFVDSGRVEEAARRAKPADLDEAAELERAEGIGKRRMKEEDPAISRRADDDTTDGEAKSTDQ